MRTLSWLKLVIGLAPVSLFAGTIEYQVNPVSGNLYQYNYFLSGYTFDANEQLDVRFDPTLYGALSNGVAPSGFSVTLLQTNNPPGDYGDYTALAQINNPSTSGTFSVQFVYLGTGAPGSQPFFLNQYNSDGFYQSTIDAGFTTSETTSSVAPEPSTFTLISVALLFGGLWMIRKRLCRHSAR